MGVSNGASGSPRDPGRGVRATTAGHVGCSSRAAKAPQLHATPSMVSGLSQPFGVAIAPGGHTVFAGLSRSVDVFSLAGSRLHLRATVALPGEALGLALSPGGRYLVAADGNGGAYVLDVAAAEQGSSAALLGQLTSTGHGAIQASVSPNGVFAFVALENSNELAVFDLHEAIATRFRRRTPTGVVPLSPGPVGIATSPDGRYLFVTSEAALESSQGVLSTVDMARAETNASRAVLTSVPAGCSPVRVVVAGRSVYVAARASNAVLWFSSRALVHRPAHAFRGKVRVGSEPVGLAAADGGRALVVADSNRFGKGRSANLAVLRLTAAGRPVLQGYLRSGAFPRDVASTPNGRVAVAADYASSQLEAVTLPPPDAWRGTSRRGCMPAGASVGASLCAPSVTVARRRALAAR